MLKYMLVKYAHIITNIYLITKLLENSLETYALVGGNFWVSDAPDCTPMGRHLRGSSLQSYNRRGESEAQLLM